MARVPSHCRAPHSDRRKRSGADEIQRGHAKLSIGVASLVPGADTKHRDLVAAADKALYQAKRLGRNRTELAEIDAASIVPDAGAHSSEGSGAAQNPDQVQSSAVVRG